MPKKPELRLQGRRIVVTGGASGIGRETAQLFASEGAKVAILDRSADEARAVADLCAGFGTGVDVSDPTSVSTALEQASKALSGLDGLVNTAGIFDTARLADTEFDLWNRVISVNLSGTFLLCKHALPYLRKEAGATIVTLGSGVALVPSGASSVAYIASKGGVVALTRAIAIEASPEVRVNCVCPGMVDTPMTKKIIYDDAGNKRPEVISNYALKRAAQPSEIASAILFLTSSDSSFVTGTTMAVDGGRTYH